MSDALPQIKYYNMQGEEISEAEAVPLIVSISDRRVAKTVIQGVVVSTLLLVIDIGGNHPLIFETMVFGGGEDLNEYTRRYSTLEEARAGHQDTCKMVSDTLMLRLPPEPPSEATTDQESVG